MTLYIRFILRENTKFSLKFTANLETKATHIGIEFFFTLFNPSNICLDYYSQHCNGYLLLIYSHVLKDMANYIYNLAGTC